MRSKPTPIALLAAAALLVGAGSFATGCGSDGDETSTDTSATVAAGQEELENAQKITTATDASDVVKVFPPNVIKDGDVAAEKEGTPERGLIEWWQAYQFTDVDRVLELTSAQTTKALGEKNLVDLVLSRGPGLQGMEILGATENGNSATVQVGLLNFEAPEGKPPPRKPTGSTPDTFAMSKEDGEWKFAETEYVQLQLDELRRSEAAAEAAAG